MRYLPIMFVVIAMFTGASWQIFWSTTDAARYQCYALTFWFGSNAAGLLPPSQCAFLAQSGAQGPFHMLPVEYPPLTLLPFSLALLAPIPYYQWAFALLMSLTAVLIYWLLLRYGPQGGALCFACYLFIGALATAQGRFDLVPATLTLICVIAADRKQWAAAYIALAFGVLFKIYPILLLPGLFIAEQQSLKRFSTLRGSVTFKTLPQQLWYTLRDAPRWRWKYALLFLGVVGGITGIFALLNFQGAVVNQFAYFAHRPVQIEATGSVFLWIAHLFGLPWQIAYTYGSVNIISPLDNLVSQISLLSFVLGYLFTLWLQWRGKLDVTQMSIAILLVFIATGKVFSPQYLIWLIPLLAYAGAFQTPWLFLWGSVSLLTTFIYACLNSQTSDPQRLPYIAGYFEAVTLRDIFFVLVTLAYLFNWFQMRQRRPLPTPLTGKETRPLETVETKL